MHDSELLLSPDSICSSSKQQTETEKRTTGNFKKPAAESSMVVSEGTFLDYTIAEIMR